jgi:hypothetical protein
MMSFIGAIFLITSISYTAVAREESLFVPPELVEVIKKDFSIKKNDDVEFVLHPMTLLIQADLRQYKRQIVGSGDKVDFSDFGKKPKEFVLRFAAEPKSEPHKELTKEPSEEPTEKEHGSSSEHAPSAEHGAPSEHGGGEAKADPVKTLYFINRYREVQAQGRSFGLPCGKVLKIQSQLDDLFITQGIKVKSASGRHLDTLGGDFILVRREGDEIFVSSFKLKDSRYADRLCKMSFE